MKPTRLITAAAVLIALLAFWPQTASAKSSWSLGVFIGSGRTTHAHTEVVTYRPAHYDCAPRYRHRTVHYIPAGNYYIPRANYYVLKERHGCRRSRRRHHRSHGVTFHARGHHH